MTSLNLLRKNIPEWYKKLPLVLPEESALDIVKKILSVDESGVAGTQLFREGANKSPSTKIRLCKHLN